MIFVEDIFNLNYSIKYIVNLIIIWYNNYN